MGAKGLVCNENIIAFFRLIVISLKKIIIEIIPMGPEGAQVLQGLAV